MRVDVEIMLRHDARVFTETIEHPVAAQAWTDGDAEAVLLKVLAAIDCHVNPQQPHSDRAVALRGITWIVHRGAVGTVLALEIHSASAVAGPFDLPVEQLEATIARVLKAASPAQVVH